MKLTRIFAAILMAVMLTAMPVSAVRNEVCLSEDFADPGLVHQRFQAGAWYFHDGGGIYGYADAKVLASIDYDWGYEFFHEDYGWLTYDATVTLTAEDDDQSDDDRWINLTYANDNPYYNGLSDGRIMMSFSYDFGENCFRFTDHWCTDAEEDQIMPPVYMDICDDGTEFYTLGISVDKDRILCFYNGQLIFDYKDTEQKYLIADAIESPFLLWQEGNFIQIKNITVAEHGWLLDDPDIAPGDANENGKVNLKDVSLILKYIAGWDVEISGTVSDVNDDGKVNLADASLILKQIAG